MGDLKIIEKAPSVEDYNNMRSLVGWRTIDVDMAKIGLRHTLYSVCLYEGDEMVAMGRVVGDMGIIFYLQDVIVHPNHQKKGYGKILIEKLLNYVKNFAPEGDKVMVGLMAACGKEKFYEKYGFVKRPDNGYGHGMSLLLSSN